MKHSITFLLFLLGLISPALGQINLPDTLEPFQPIIATCDVPAPEGASIKFTWHADEKTRFEVPDTNNQAKIYGWAPPGPHSLQVQVIVQTFQEIFVWVPDPDAPGDITKAKPQKLKIQSSFEVKTFEKKFTVTGAVPTPTPTPGPTPDPTPTPTPAPGAISVLITYEASSDFTKPELAPYLDVLNSTKIRGYLNSHCAKGPDGKTPEWRQWDVNTDVSHERQKWQDVMKLPRQNDFWYIISNGTAGTSGPLPKDQDEFLKILQQWGGA